MYLCVFNVASYFYLNLDALTVLVLNVQHKEGVISADVFPLDDLVFQY